MELSKIVLDIILFLYLHKNCLTQNLNSKTSIMFKSVLSTTMANPVSTIAQSSGIDTNSVQQNFIPTCSCGVFLTGQFNRGKPPVGNSVILHEMEEQVSCNPAGVKQCTNRCIEGLVKYLPNSPSIVCGSIDRDCFKERAYLFVKNCNNNWTNTNLSAGKEYCCKDGVYYKCPNKIIQ